MAQNYIRQSTFSDGDKISASLFNNEYDQLVNAFSYSSTSAISTGHRHDGTLGQGGNIFKIGDLDFLNKIEVDSTNNRWGFYVEVSNAAVEQIRIQDGGIVPVTDSDIDIGTTSLRFKDAFIDTITTTSNVAIGGNLTVTGNATIAGNLTFGDAATDTVSFSADVASNLLPSTNNTFDLGASSSQWKDLYIDGTANIDSLVADTADINGGTIDGATIATSNITVGSGKTLDVSAGTLTLADNQISGDKVEGGTIAATTITDLTFGSLNDGAITITAFADEDDMSSNSATLVPTQQSVKAYVDAQVTAQDLDLTTDSGTIAIDLDSETLTVSGGTGIDSSATGNAVTLAIDSTVATLTGSQTLTNKTLTSPVINTPDINTPDIDGGTIDSTVIGGATPAAGTFTTLTANTSITGTLATAAQTNITSVGTLSSLTVSGGVTVGGNLTLNSTESVKVPVGTTAQRDVNPTAGMFRYNTTEGAFEGYTDEWGSIGGGGSSTSFSTFSVDTMTGDGSDTTLTLAADPLTENNTHVFIDGVYQPKSTYSVSGTTLTFSTAPSNGSSVEVTSSPNVTFYSNTMTGDGSDTTLTLSANPGSEDKTIVYIDGVYQPKSTYSVSGTTLTFSTAPPSGSIVEAMGAGSADVFNIASMTGNGSLTTLTIPANPGSINNTFLFIDGVYQPKNSYSIEGTTLTFSEALPNGANAEVILGNSLAVNFPTDGTVTSAKLAGSLTTPSDLTVNGTTDTTNFKVGGAQGTDGQVLTSTGSGVAWESPAATKWTEISTVTLASSDNVTQIDYNNFDANYIEFELRLSGLTLIPRMYLDFGSGPIETSTYSYKAIYSATNSSTSGPFYSRDASKSAIFLAEGSQNSGEGFAHLIARWTNKGSLVTSTAVFASQESSGHGLGHSHTAGMHYTNRNNTITGVRLKLGSSNLVGTFTLYGLSVS